MYVIFDVSEDVHKWSFIAAHEKDAALEEASEETGQESQHLAAGAGKEGKEGGGMGWTRWTSGL
jgi:hypothetical protein